LKAADGGSNGGKDRFDQGEVVTPVAVAMRPAEEDGVLIFPFGREARSHEAYCPFWAKEMKAVC